MSDKLILVTSATGKTGSRVAAHLVERAIPTRAVSRHSSVRFDWNDASTWQAALDGVRAVYIVHPGLGFDGATEQIADFARAAAAAGIKHAVLASTPDDGRRFRKPCAWQSSISKAPA